MTKRKATACTVAVLAAILWSVEPPAASEQDDAAKNTRIDKGREIAFDRNKGNCLACHMLEGGELPGNLGPPLVAMQRRFPDRAVLRTQIWDAAVQMPTTRMPPFGRHRILTEDEIDDVVEFLLTL